MSFYSERRPFIHTTGADDGDKKIDPKAAELAHAREGWMDFRDRHEGTMNAYYGTPDVRFTMKPGGWYIDLKKLEVNADPTFFLEKGFTESEALFASFHEAGHFDDMVQDANNYLAFFERVNEQKTVHPAYPKALKRLYNCVEDVLVNKKVMARWKAGHAAKDSLYPKLFPASDFRGQPRHRQLMYALLREAMLPGEPCEVDADVREQIDLWQKRGRGARALDVLTAVDRVGKARVPLQNRFLQYQGTLEPVFRAFFLRDLQDRKPKSPEKGEGKGSGDPGEPGDPGEDDPFGEDPNDSAIPDPIDFDDLANQVKKLNDKIAQNKKDAFKEAMGVDQKDFTAYQKDAIAVAPYVERMSQVFDKVIKRRKTYRRVLKKPVDEGAIPNPPRQAGAVAEIQAGNEPHEVFLDYQLKEIVRNRPDELEFTLVGDGSGSMGDEGKDVMQRKIAVLVQEGLQKFRERIERERRQGEKIQLIIRGEVRIFADNDHPIVPLSDHFNHVDRVRMHKALNNLPRGGNNEPATFQAIRQEQFQAERLKKLREGKLKKVILFLTDGQTDQIAIQAQIAAMYEEAGPDSQNHLIIAGIGFGNGTQATATYAPNGYFVETLAQVPETFIAFFEKVIDDL